MKSARYTRQTSLKEFGAASQKKLAEAKVLVVGVGGLGIPVSQYLNAMGIGTLGLVDQDTVNISNLQRQTLYDEKDVGRPKLTVALEKLKAQNSDTNLIGYDSFLGSDNALEIIRGYDVVVDASDNFPTRYLLNDACVILKKPFVYGALHGFEGHVSVFNYRGGPTYRCLFPVMPKETEIPDCNENGVLGVIPGIIGTLQALEVVKLVTETGEVLCGKLLLYNGLNQSTLKINFEPIPANLRITRLQESYGEPFCSTSIEISARNFRKLMEAKKRPQIIDVRTREEYNSYHLQNARNIPLNEIEERIAEIDIEEPVYLLCQSGKRSELAQQMLLKSLPRSTVYSVTGGMDNYTLTCP